MDFEEKGYQEAGVEFQHYQLRHAPEEELGDAVADADVVVVDQAKMSERVLKAASHCGLVIRHGDGYDNVDIDAATQLGIAVANKPGFWSQEVAEQALTVALALFRKLPQQIEVASHPRTGSGPTWNLTRLFPIRRISDSVFGVVGFGRIGRRVTSLAAALFDVVLVHDPYVDGKDVRKQGGSKVELSELLGQSDVVSLHVPVTTETHGLIDSHAFQEMKRAPVFVNTARGSLVDTNALVRALEDGSVSAAALDATNPEPLPEAHKLRSFKNVVITPHLGWYSHDAMEAMRRSIVEDVLRYADGTYPASVINSKVVPV